MLEFQMTLHMKSLGEPSGQGRSSVLTDQYYDLRCATLVLLSWVQSSFWPLPKPVCLDIFLISYSWLVNKQMKKHPNKTLCIVLYIFLGSFFFKQLICSKVCAEIGLLETLADPVTFPFNQAACLIINIFTCSSSLLTWKMQWICSCSECLESSQITLRLFCLLSFYQNLLFHFTFSSAFNFHNWISFLDSA